MTAFPMTLPITGSRSSTTLDLGVSFLLRFIGGTDATQFAVKRAGADPNFSIFKPSLYRQQLLPGNWTLTAKIDGQIASGPLISNEQYGAGGLDSVRGYTESERLGDNGVHGSLELRTPQLLNKMTPGISQSYLYVFQDYARVRTLDPLPAQITGYRLLGSGLGAHFKFRNLTADVDGAHAETAGYVTRKGADSVQFRVNYAW